MSLPKRNERSPQSLPSSLSLLYPAAHPGLIFYFVPVHLMNSFLPSTSKSFYTSILKVSSPPPVFQFYLLSILFPALKGLESCKLRQPQRQVGPGSAPRAMSLCPPHSNGTPQVTHPALDLSVLVSTLF